MEKRKFHRTLRTSYHPSKLKEDPKDTILRQYEEEITHLRTLLEERKSALKDQKEGKPKGEGQADLEKEIGSLIEEHKLLEKKHGEELRALLQPYGIDGAKPLTEIMDELEKRKAALVNDEKAVKEDKDRLLEELHQATKSMMDSKRQCKKLFQRIINLEMQIQQSQQKDEELKVKEKELAEQNVREEGFRKALELKKLTSNDLKLELSKLQGAIDEKKDKCEKFEEKLRTYSDESKRLNCTHFELQEQMHSLKSELTRELKLKKMIADNFIPRKILKKREERMRYSEKDEKYILIARDDTSFPQPKVDRKLMNPYLNMTRYSNLAKVNDIYYSNENLLAVEPEQPIGRSQELILEDEDPIVENIVEETLRELGREVVVICDTRTNKS